MPISAKEYLRRLSKVNKAFLEKSVHDTIMSDHRGLRERKIAEFEVGERPDGRKIGNYRDPEYAFFKMKINPRAGGYVDLLLSRSFVNQMNPLLRTPRHYLLNSQDEKQNKLIGQYGIDILSINQEWFEKRQKELYKFVLVQDIKKYAKIQ